MVGRRMEAASERRVLAPRRCKNKPLLTREPFARNLSEPQLMSQDGNEDGAGSGGGANGDASAAPDGGADADADADAEAARALGPAPPLADASPAAAINAAHILVTQQRHASALAILEPLFARADELHGGAALHVCLLLLDVRLAARQHAKAAEVLAYLETAFGLGGGSGGGGDAAAATTAADGSSDGGGGGGGGVGSSGGGGGNGEQAEQAAGPAPSPPASDALRLPRATRITSPTMDAAAALLRARGAAPQAMPDVRLLLHLLRARLALSAGLHKAAKRELRPLLAARPRCAAALAFKARLEAARARPRRALQTLAALAAPAPPSPPGGGAGVEGSSAVASKRAAARVTSTVVPS